MAPAASSSEKLARPDGPASRPSAEVSSHGDSTKLEDNSAPAATNGNSKDTSAKETPDGPDGTGDADPFRHLPDDEAAVLRRQVILPEVKTGFVSLYRYASANDLIIIAVSAVCAIASGAALPLMTVIFGNLQHVFQDYFFLQTMTYDEFTDELVTLVLYFVYLAIGEFVVTYVATVGFICKSICESVAN